MEIGIHKIQFSVFLAVLNLLLDQARRKQVNIGGGDGFDRSFKWMRDHAPESFKN